MYLKNAIEIALKHKSLIEETLRNTIGLFPLDAGAIASLGYYQKVQFDSLFFRLSKLQDLMGTTILPRTAELLRKDNYPAERKLTFIDQLNFLEREGLIKSTFFWTEARNDPHLAANAANDGMKAAKPMLTDLETITKRISELNLPDDW